jgi:hypothetical protein
MQLDAKDILPKQNAKEHINLHTYVPLERKKDGD